jgi:hypothetical protein
MVIGGSGAAAKRSVPHIYAENKHPRTPQEPAVNSSHHHPTRRGLGDVAFAVVLGRLVGTVSGLWRFQRFIWRLMGLGLGLMVVSFIVPGLVFTLLSTAALWPVYAGGAFALWARRSGDRVGLKVYAERVSAAVAANRELVTKGAVLAAIAGLSLDPPMIGDCGP